jgi:hypothetical protein
MESHADSKSKFEFYQNSVQNAKKEAEFFKKEYRMIFNKVPTSFREDFCGTAKLSCEWVKSNVMNTAVGIDFDEETLIWARENNISNLNSGSDRIELINMNVLTEYNPDRKFDIICSLNYSHFLLNKRTDLLKYFINVRKNIKKGLFIIDLYGGAHIYSDHKYQHQKSSDFYEFSGKQVNILNNTSLCSLNYKVSKKKFTPLFSFKFRIYSIIELLELLEESGFSKVEEKGKYKLFLKEINDDEEDEYQEYEEVDLYGEYFPESERYTGFLISII